MVTPERQKIKKHISSFVQFYYCSILLEAEQAERLSDACYTTAWDHARTAAALINRIYGEKIGKKLALKMVLLHPEAVLNLL